MFISLINTNYYNKTGHTTLSQETEYNNEGEWEEDIHERENELDDLRRQADATAAKIQALKKLKLVKSKYGQPNYTIDNVVLEEIDEIITKRTTRYPNWEKFVDESLKNTITFWQRPQDMMAVAGKLWKDMTVEMKKEIKKNAADFFMVMDDKFGLHNKVATTVSEIHQVRTRLSNVKFQKPENILYGYYDPEKDTYQTNVIHETYNRFFPLKLLVTTLASMIHEKMRSDIPGDREWIDYKQFSKEALEFAQEISNKLKKIKSKAGRSERISTGLPIGFPHNQLPDKIEASNERFLKCFVGHKGATQVFAGKPIHRGALNETGLVYIREKNKRLEITLSKEGFKFYEMKNPIIDGIHHINEDENGKPLPGNFLFKTNDEGSVESKAFSDEEKNFIMKKIIAKFPLENKIVNDILSAMSAEQELDHHKIDDIISKLTDVDKDKIKIYRMATMGRLAEIGTVNWEIRKGNSGKAESFYSIPT